MKNLPIVKSMVRRVITHAKKHKLQRGGAASGQDVNSISTFTPSSIPDLALWIKVSRASITYSTIAEYIPTQSISVQQDLRESFRDKLDTSVITEIKGVKGSLVRFELDSSKSLSFPTYISDPSGNHTISLAFDTNSFKLVTKEHVNLENKFSIFSTSENVDINYIRSFNQIIIEPNQLAYIKTPVSKFSEIIVYSRELTRLEKEQIEGYLAYVNNNQYNLPLAHRFLPDMSFLPELSPVVNGITDIDKAIAMSTEELNKVVESRKEQSETDLTLRGRLTAAHEDLVRIRQIFSKGALLTKEPRTIESIFDAANSLNILTVPFAPKYIEYTISEILKLISEIDKYIEGVKASTPDSATILARQEAAAQASELESAQSEEIFEATQIEFQAHEFYEKLRRKSHAISANGASLYEPLYKNFEDVVSIYLDSITHTNKRIESEWLILINSFKPIETQINSRAWLKYVSTIDISESEIIMRGASVYSIQYRDNYLNTIQTQYQKIRNQIYDGDMAYISTSISNKIDELNNIYKEIQEREIQPIMIKTFLPHFKQRYNEITKYAEKFTGLLELITTSINTITAALESSNKNGKVPSLDDLPVISNDKTYRSECDTMYIRMVNPSDATLTGIEYIVTDVEGNIQNAINDNGEIDNSYIFSKGLKFSKEDNMFFIYHPYKDENGNAIRQEIKILDPLPSLSIIDSLTSTRRPKYWFHKGTSLFEIPREQNNGIHQFVCEGAQYPIQLPKYAITKGSYFLIQNVGPIPIQIQNPGFPDDFIDTIGYGESILYIYSGLSEINGNTYYGRVTWREGYVPYDTLLNSPRSAYSVFVKELGEHIYVKKNLEPILDFDEYFIKVLTDSNGYTYDIDDVYKANPYKVQSMKEVSISELKNKGSKISINEAPEILVLKDIVTGLPVLCNSKGVPGINEFGFCKFAKTPIMLIDNNRVIRGAFGDIKVSIKEAETIEQMGVLEPFLKFDAVYRSKFVQSYAKDAIKTFVFIGMSKYPILSPTNKFIEAEGWSLVLPQEITYSNSKYTTAIAYISPTTIKDSPIVAEPYPYIQVQETRIQIEMKKAAKIIIKRYMTDKNYIINCIDIIKQNYTDVEGLGKVAAEGIQSILTSATKQIQADYDKYLTYEPSVEPIQASLDKSILTNTLKVAIDMLDLKMKEIIESVASTFNTLTESIENTNKLLNDIKSVEASVVDLRTGVVEIENHIISVKGTFQADAQNNKITGAPEFDRLLKLMIKLKIDFLQKLAILEDSMKVRPEYTTEIPPWIKVRREQIKELNQILIKIREIEQLDIPRVFSARETAENTKQVQKFNEMISQLKSYTKYKDAVGLWIGIPSLPTYAAQKPLPGEPIVKGLSIELNIFNELTNPSIQRDWIALQASAEISGRIASELLTPIEALKNKYRASFFEDKTPLPEIPKQQSLAQMREIVDRLSKTLSTTTQQLLAFESELAPILKAYENIRVALRAELRKKLEENRQKIQDKWIELTGKRTAIQTLLVQSPDPAKEAELEKQFEIEPRVLELTTDFDDVSYFNMKELIKTQEEILSSLEGINV